MVDLTDVQYFNKTLLIINLVQLFDKEDLFNSEYDSSTDRICKQEYNAEVMNRSNSFVRVMRLQSGADEETRL